MKYHPEIDGLRAFAVLSVLIYHVFPDHLKGGFIGVDIFFVISGYLITYSILESIDKGVFSFLDFYRRRIRRIFPALIPVLIATIIFGWFVLLEDEYAQLGKHIASSVGFIQNFILAEEVGYFDNSANTKPLLHLWSLSVEEQFYFIWPLIIYLTWKKKLNLITITSILLLISFIANIKYIDSKPVEAFFWSVGRFWEFLSGSVLAWLVFNKNNTLLSFNKKIDNYLILTYVGKNQRYKVERNILVNIISLMGIMILLYGVIFIHDNLKFPGNWALVPVIGTLMVIYSGPSALINRVLLANKLVVWIGLISYPLYLWHYPIISFLHIVYGEINVAARILVIVTSFFLAWLTYKFIELPVRMRQYNKGLYLILIMLLIIAGGIGSWIYSKDGFKHRIESDANIKEALEDWSYPGKLKRVKNNGISYISNKIQKPRVIFLGDSHLEQYGPRVSDLSNKNKTKPIAFLTGGGCLPMPNIIHGKGYDHCYELFKKFNILLKGDSVEYVVVGACFNCYLIPNKGYRHFVKNGEKISLTSKEGVKIAKELFYSFIISLSEKHKVIVLLDSPRGEGFSPKILLNSIENKGRPFFIHNIKIPKRKIFNLDMDSVILESEMKKMFTNTSVQVLSQSNIICPDKICNALSEDGRPIYKDGDHMRPWFVQDRMDVLDKIINN
jgi:peptidoglycan/LPS O-acetylase OafA/YrhL